MNFQDLLTKMKQLDESTTPVDYDDIGGDEMSREKELVEPKLPGDLDECGMDMMPPKSPAQSDSVTMNVSMNGSGKGGIRDLMDVLRNLENAVDNTSEPQSGDDSEHDVLVGDSTDGGFGDATTAPNEVTLDIDSITDIGHPINSGDHRKRQAGLPVGSPMREGLVSHLSNLYNEVKNR